MRALRWILWIGAVVVIVAGLAIAAGAMWLNTFIHSESFRHEVEMRAGQSLGGTVQIQSIDFDVFNGVKLQGLVTQIDASHVGGQGALQANVQKVNCTYAWKELFSRRLKLTGVTLDEPQIVLTKQPTAPLAPTEASPGTAVTPGNPTPTTLSGSVPATASGTSAGSPAPEPKPAMPFQFILDRAKINNGSVSLRDVNGAPMVDLHGVEVAANTSGYYDGKDVTGTVKIAEAILPSGLKITNFSTPVLYRIGVVEAKPFSASAFGGNIAGGYQLGSINPSVLDLNATGFDVAQLTAATKSNSPAKLSGSLDLQSKWRGIETGDLNGEGDAQLTKGKIEGVKILHDLSQILRVKELDEPIITKAQTHFVVKDKQTNFIGLELNSPIFKITGNGVVAFDGRLDANLVLILTREAMAKLPKEAAASFVQQSDGTGSIAFRVYGTTSRAETDLATRLLMQNTQIKNVINKALNKFFH